MEPKTTETTLRPGTRIKVDSSMFMALTYELECRELVLELHDGSVWKYFDVPEHLVRSMLDAESKGKFYHAWIKELFEYEVVRDVGGRMTLPPAPQRHADPPAA